MAEFMTYAQAVGEQPFGSQVVCIECGDDCECYVCAPGSEEEE